MCGGRRRSCQSHQHSITESCGDVCWTWRCILLQVYTDGKEIYDLKVSPVHPYIIGTAAKDHTIRLWTLDPRSATQPTIAICGGEGGHREGVLTLVLHPKCFTNPRHFMRTLCTYYQEVWTMQSVSGYVQFSSKQLLVTQPLPTPSLQPQISQNAIPTLTSPPPQSIPTTSTA